MRILHLVAVLLLGALVACSGPTPPSCTFAVSPASASYGVSGGSGTVSLTTGSSCDWTASAGASWIGISGPTSGKGSASIAYTVAANTGGSRSGTLTVAGQPVSITEAAQSTFSIGGTVRDAFMNGVIAGATVAISSGPTSGSAVTDGTGRYTLSSLQAGAYTLQVSAPPFAAIAMNVTVPAASDLDANLVLSTPTPFTAGDLTGNWTGTGVYPNDPFKLEILQTGNALQGAYQDQHDRGIGVSGTYSNPTFVIRVDFGDGVLILECAIDDARHIHGVQRTSALGNRPYNFTMTR